MNPNNNNDVVSYFIASYQQRDFEPKFMVVSNWYKYQGFLAFYIDYSHISSFCSTKKLFAIYQFFQTSWERTIEAKQFYALQ